MVPMILLAGQQQRRRHREQTCRHSGGRRGRDELKSNTETYVLSYVKQIARENVLCEAGSSNRCSVTM